MASQQLDIEMTVKYNDGSTTITQSGHAFSDEYNDALLTGVHRVAEALINLTRFDIKEKI